MIVEASCNSDYKEFDFIEYSLDPKDEEHLKKAHEHLQDDLLLSVRIHFYGEARVFKDTEEMRIDTEYIDVNRHFSVLCLVEKYTEIEYTCIL